MVGIVIVSYHNAEMTARFVRKELPKLTVPYTLVVVNNDSTPEECRSLAERCGVPEEYVLCSKENLGYACGNNMGVKYLKELCDCSYYLFTNDDVEIKSGDILDVLCKKLDSMPNIAGIGPRVIGLDGKDQSPHDKYISPYRKMGWKIFGFMRRKKDALDSTWRVPVEQIARLTYWVQGSFMLVKAVDFDMVDGFDSETFLYYEEPILAERFKMIGKGFFYEPSVEIVHYEGGSSKKISKKLKTINKASALLYYKKYKKINNVILWLYRLICED